MPPWAGHRSRTVDALPAALAYAILSKAADPENSGFQINSRRGNSVHVVAGVDLGGTAINYTLVNGRSSSSSKVCSSIRAHPKGAWTLPPADRDGLKKLSERPAFCLHDVVVVGLDTPGPASADGVLSAEGSTNFLHPDWSGFDIRGILEKRLGKPGPI